MHIKDHATAQGWFRRHAAAPSSVGSWKAFVEQNKRAQEPRTMAQGGGMMGQLVRNTVDGSRPGYSGPGTKWTEKEFIEVKKLYEDIFNDYNEYTTKAIEEGNITKIKGMNDFFKKKEYKTPDGKPVRYSTVSSYLRNHNKAPLPPQEIKKIIYNNAVMKANQEDKWISKKKLAQQIGLKNEKELSSFTTYNTERGAKLKELDSVNTKMFKNADKFFSDLNQPVENFFSSINKIAEMTGVSQSAGSVALKNYKYPVDKQIIKSLGAISVQGKVAGLDWKLDDFIDYYNNKSFMEPSTLKQLANVDATSANIVQDAWRHTLDGGKDIEWIEKPKLNKDGKVSSWLDAKFKYVGEDIDTPLNQRKIWTVGNQNPNKNIFNIEFVGRDAPEFKKQFQLTEDIFNFNNELVEHPVKKTMVKRGQLMKEMYHYGTGTGFTRPTVERDHFNIKKDPFGLKKHKVNGNLVDGLRMVPTRINRAAGQIKQWKSIAEKGLGSPLTILKYAEQAGADKYTAIGYNFNKTPAELAASEYEFAKKFFNKFQAAGWQWDGKNWKIKSGMDDSANAVLTNEGRIIKKPIDIATDYKKIGQTILKEGDLSYFKGKEKSEILQMAAGEGSKASKLFAQLYSSKEGRKTLKEMTSLTGINDYLRANGMDPICVTKSPKKCGMDLIKSEGGVDAYRSELEKRISNAKGDEKWFKAYNNPKMASVKNFFKGAGKKLWKIGKAGVVGELYYIPFGTAYETGKGKNLLEALDNSIGLGGHFGMEEKNLMKYADTAGYSEEDKKFFSQFAQLDKNDNWTTFWQLAAMGDEWAMEQVKKYVNIDPAWNLQEFAAGKVKDLETESENIMGELSEGLETDEGIYGKWKEREHLKDVQAIDWINKAKEKEANVIINRALTKKANEAAGKDLKWPLAPPAEKRWLVMENLIDAFTQEDWLKKVKEEGLKTEEAGPLWSMLTSPVGAAYAAGDKRIDEKWRKKILEGAGREDLLYKEYMHPLYGASFSTPQAASVDREDTRKFRSSRAGGGLANLTRTVAPDSEGIMSLKKW